MIITDLKYLYLMMTIATKFENIDSIRTHTNKMLYRKILAL